MFQEIIDLIIQRYSMDSYNILDKVITIPFSLIFLGIFNLIKSYGLTIIVFTVLTKIVLLPVSAKAKRSMMKQTRLTPKVTELQKKYPNDKARQQQEIQQLYAAEGVSMAGCLWSLLPFPILIALYAVIRLPLTNLMGLDFAEIQNVAATCFNGLVYEKTTYGELALAQMIQENFEMVRMKFPDMLRIDFKFLGVDLTEIPNWRKISGITFIPILSGALSFLTGWINQKMNPVALPAGGDKSNPAAGMTKSMLYTAPLISVWIGFIMPLAMSLYWIINNLTTIVQEYFLTKKYKKEFAELDAKAEELRAAERAKEEEERKKIAELREQGLTQKNPNTSKRKNIKEIPQPKSVKKEAKPKNNSEQGAGDSAAGVVGGRRYARGRAYVADRFNDGLADNAASPETEEYDDTLAISDAADAPGAVESAYEDSEMASDEDYGDMEEYADDFDDADDEITEEEDDE